MRPAGRACLSGACRPSGRYLLTYLLTPYYVVRTPEYRYHGICIQALVCRPSEIGLFGVTGASAAARTRLSRRAGALKR